MNKKIIPAQLLIPIYGADWKHRLLQWLINQKDFPTKLRLFNILKSILNIHYVKAVTKSGVILLLDLSDWVQNNIFYFGNYEQKSLKLFKTFAKDAKVIVDVGAHIGQYALECAEMDQISAQMIFALEANPKNFSHLLNNILLNSYRQIIPVLGAVSDREDLAQMSIPGYWNLGNTQVIALREFDPRNYLIAKYKIGTLLDKFQLSTIDLMKVDIEGHEYHFFRGLIEQKIYPKRIVFEFIPKVFSNGLLCVDLLKQNNYKLFTIDMVEFNNEDEVPEQNLVAILQ